MQTKLYLYLGIEVNHDLTTLHAVYPIRCGYFHASVALVPLMDMSRLAFIHQLEFEGSVSYAAMQCIIADSGLWSGYQGL